jgi:tRNA-(ms[2]io[6]A)-hydroxylase
MLGLKLETDPRWVNIVEKNIEEILTDHAWCEQKAASYAIMLMTKYSRIPELVDKMTALAQEELTHFEMVHDQIKKRNLTLGEEGKDPYVHDLMKFMKRGGSPEGILADRLLIAAMIEARSCERFRVLSENIKDEELSVFYRDLMASEARHYTMFISLARKLAPSIDVDARWEEFLTFEAGIMKGYGKKETVHG